MEVKAGYKSKLGNQGRAGAVTAPAPPGDQQANRGGSDSVPGERTEDRWEDLGGRKDVYSRLKQDVPIPSFKVKKHTF